MKMKPTPAHEGKKKEEMTVSLLMSWYQENARRLPWRLNQDPYRIWISEVMLQQTTVQAVIPFYERFMARFPDVRALAKASLEEVFELWAGLGYYSRARNLHKAATQFAQTGFPKMYSELILYPGLGPYTARAVASIAFNEPVGVLDGNVIRVLSRYYGLRKLWWIPKVREELQDIADGLAQKAEPRTVNQAMMELGATICTPQNPICLLCPLNQTCIAREKNLISQLPLKKPRKKFEIWIWKPQIVIQKQKVALIQNDYAPFLKGQYIFPGEIKRASEKPKKFTATHTITHHQIFVQPKRLKALASAPQLKWVPLKSLQRVNPSILLQKALMK